jgi:hypothetical protein
MDSPWVEPKRKKIVQAVQIVQGVQTVYRQGSETF